MLTVTQMARACGVSRTTVLYYESLGLLPAAPRSGSNYRIYGEKHLSRLRQICTYRGAGLRLADIRVLVAGDPRPGAAAAVLSRRLNEIGAEVGRLKEHQCAILKLMEHQTQFRGNNMDKEKWVAIMRGAGFQEDDMRKWHVEFERAAPEDHQVFLEYLKIPSVEIDRIRAWSRM